MRFTVPGEPVAKGRGRAVRRGAHVQIVTPDKTRRFEDRVRVHAQEAGVAPIMEGPVRVRIKALWEWPRSMWRKGTPRMEVYRDGGPDADNVAKAVLDALNGIAWGDDRQVAVLQVEKLRAAQGEPARVEVEIEAL